MSIEHHIRAVKTALENTAEGAFTVDDVKVVIADGKQTISLTGAHQDGTPIAYKSLPFVGDSAERAKEIARRIMVAHQVRVDAFTDGASLVKAAPPVDLKVNTANVSREPMANTPKLNSLMTGFDGFIAKVEAAAAALHTRMEKAANYTENSVAKFAGGIAKVEGVAKQIEDAANQMTNGGPPLDSSASPPTAPTTGPTTGL